MSLNRSSYLMVVFVGVSKIHMLSPIFLIFSIKTNCLYVFVRLTQQQKQTRIDWIVEDLKANGVLPQDSNVDSRLFVIRSADQVCYI